MLEIFFLPQPIIWRVKTNNGGHWSSYSDVRNFSTNGANGIQTYSALANQVICFPQSFLKGNSLLLTWKKIILLRFMKLPEE